MYVTKLFLDTLFPAIEKSMHNHDLHGRRLQHLQHIENFFREIRCNCNTGQNGPPPPPLSIVMVIPMICRRN